MIKSALEYWACLIAKSNASCSSGLALFTELKSGSILHCESTSSMLKVKVA